jgi:hypothetical protein
MSGAQTLAPYANVNASQNAFVDQSEMAVAVNPTNPLNVAGFSHYIAPTLNYNQIALYHSGDGGATWALTLIGGTGSVNSDGLGSATGNIRFDPTVKFDADGNLFVAYGAYTSSATKLVVAKSTDGGASLANGDFRVVDDQVGYGGVDKFYLGTGPAGPASSGAALYVAYERNAGGQPIMVAGSKDAGASWTAPVIVDPGGSFYAGPAVGPEGELYVTWVSLGDKKIKVRAKPDGLWGPGPWKPTVAARNLTAGLAQFPIPPQSRRGIYNNPVIDVDRSGGPHNGRVYVTFTDRVGTTGFNTDIFLTYSDDGGQTWSATGRRGNVEHLPTSEFHSWVAVDQSSGSVTVLYKTNDGDPDVNSSVTRVASSFDGGVSFLSKVDIADRRSRALSASYTGEFLDYTGLDVHDGTIQGFWSDNRGPTSGTYTTDLESYSGKVAFVSTTGANQLLVKGDDGGAATDDTILLRRSTVNPDFFEVVVNGKTQFAGLLKSVNAIEIDGLKGNNAVVVQGDFAGVSITVAGGTDGRNLMIAGATAATLVGGTGEDILIGGTTAWDDNPAALAAIMAEWSRTDLSYRQRLVHLVRGGGLNGSYVLNPSTVTANGLANTLTGDGGRDIFFVDGFDTADFDPGMDTLFQI